MSGVSREELRQLMKDMAPVIAENIKKGSNIIATDISQKAFDECFEAVKKYVDRSFDKVYEKIATIEKKGVEYRGVYQAAQLYERGNIVTLKGSMWHANIATRSVPGTSNDWTLCVKAGRDAR